MIELTYSYTAGCDRSNAKKGIHIGHWATEIIAIKTKLKKIWVFLMGAKKLDFAPK